MHQKQQQQQQQQLQAGKASGQQNQPVPILRHKSLPSSLNSRHQSIQPPSLPSPTSSSPSTPQLQHQQPLQYDKSPVSTRKQIGISCNHRAMSSESVMPKTSPMSPRHPVQPRPKVNSHPQQKMQRRKDEQNSKHQPEQNLRKQNMKPKLQELQLKKTTPASPSSKHGINTPRQDESNQKQSPLSPTSQNKASNQQNIQNQPPQSPNLHRRADSPKVKGTNPKPKKSRLDLALALSTQQKGCGQKSPSSPTSPSLGFKARPPSPLTVPSSPSQACPPSRLNQLSSKASTGDPNSLGQPDILPHYQPQMQHSPQSPPAVPPRNQYFQQQHHHNHLEKEPNQSLHPKQPIKTATFQEKQDGANCKVPRFSQEQNVALNKKMFSVPTDVLVDRGILRVTTASVYDCWDSEDGEESLV
ncbi:hypothetical protein PoB_000801400 [Plakobranchus ocellatus]|uniref:Uncharacterized protein n=1 Tax=Plakobranchus ocellatus TaxID=259542 RepID=A0AAV3YEV3_9GAST|nr:hypothetical protein PoB_000801400 [Plakobranchus ocellatus]